MSSIRWSGDWGCCSSTIPYTSPPLPPSAESLQLRYVMSTVTKCIKSIKRRGLNTRSFKKLLEDLNADYHNLIYYYEVRSMSRSDMLTHFYLLRNEVCQFMNMQGIPVAGLSDSGWLCDLAVMVDISIFLN